MKLFFGKISQDKGEQHDLNFYAAGSKGSPWYNGLEVGDYVFPIFGGNITKLWQVKEYSKTPVTKKSFANEAIHFKVVKTFDNPIHLATQFCMYKYFDIDLALINKSTKSTAKEQKGFFKIATNEMCPEPESINLLESRKIIIALEDSNNPCLDNDIRVLIKEENNEYQISDIQIMKNGQFMRYKTLWDLYDLKNKDKYSLNELLNYSIQDEATKKNNYLNDVIADLDEKSYFVASNPIALYDNILVGRKKFIYKRKNKAEASELEENGDGVDELIDEEKFDQYMHYVDLLNFNPNLILYGPPGTGKTYTAQRIVEAFEFKLTKEPTISFEEINKEGRVEFVTFHQSYSYEEFVEGIRPVINTEDDNENDVKDITYEIKPGIIRNMTKAASLNILKEDVNNLSLKGLKKESRIFKVSLGQRSGAEHIYKQCKKEEIIAIGWLESMDLKGKDVDFIYNQLKVNKEGSDNPRNDSSSINLFVNEMSEGDIVFIYDGPFTIRDVGIITSDYIYNEKRDEYRHTRKVKWIKEFDTPLDISSYNGNTRLTLKTIYPLNRITFDDLASVVGKDDIKKDSENKTKPFFIIIDEINRGNISKIFGELITLIEKDKRDSLKLTLPYSQKPFTLPSNLYFIGTMNTADRSIAILDTALRRRFVFKELEPNSEIITNASDNSIIEGKINLAILLDALNLKIEKLYDRDHRIGHSYFLKANTIKSLRQVWYYQIIPLLLEYFYNDGEKVAEIIGDIFIEKKTCSVHFNLTNEQFTEGILKICN